MRYERDKLVRELVSQGFLDTEIAAKIGGIRESIYKIRKRLGIRSAYHIKIESGDPDERRKRKERRLRNKIAKCA